MSRKCRTMCLLAQEQRGSELYSDLDSKRTSRRWGGGGLCKPSHSQNLRGEHVFVGTDCQGHRQNILQSRWLSHVALPTASPLSRTPNWGLMGHLPPVNL